MHRINEEKRHIFEKKSNIIVWFFVSIVIFLSITKIIIANQMVGASDKLHKLDVQIQKLETSNGILSEDLRQKESLLTLQTKTQQLGFTQTSKYSFLKPSESVAFVGQSNNF